MLGISELLVFCGVFFGVGFGFLWWNVFFVMIFMGDIGLLLFGGVFGVIVIVVKYEIVLVIVGGFFVLEMVLVMV